MAEAPFQRDHFKSWVTVPVRWGDMDAMGHVNNAMYMTYLESARIHLFAELGMERPMDDAHIGFALVSVTCNFRQQVQFPATLEIGTAVERIGMRSFHLIHGMFWEGTDRLAADSSSVVAWVDYAKGQSIPLSEAMRALLERMLAPQKK
ncbi:MAG: acyl-CoA thioesterase [Candidatus Hydrogenedentes bacterium]|nr:acyl-CoA thioesterase [Candidatus Hydrogenedentota bacterium]